MDIKIYELSVIIYESSIDHRETMICISSGSMKSYFNLNSAIWGYLALK